MNNLINESVTFAQTNGRFANPYDLGLAAGQYYTGDYAGYADQGPTNAMSPYTNQNSRLYMGDTSNPTPCGQTGLLIQGFDPNALGFQANTVTQFYFHCYYWHTGSGIQQACAYILQQPSGYSTANIVPNWINACGDSNCDASSALTAATASMSSATCQ